MNFRSLSWTSISQACASLSNLLLAVFVARNSSLESFGAYGIAFSTYLISLGIIRAIVGDPALLRWREWHEDGAEHVANNRKNAASACLLVSLALSAIVLAASLFSSGELASALLMMAVTLPLTLGLDVMRYWSFAEGRAKSAALIDGAWLLIQIASFVVLTLISALEMPLVVLAWGLSAIVPVAVIGMHQRWRIGLKPSYRWLQQHGRISRTYLAEFITYVGVQQSVPFLVLIFAGLPASGSLRSAQTIMGPVNVVTGSANVAFIPRARAIWRNDPLQLRPFTAKVSFALFGFVAVSAIAIQFVPTDIGEIFLGESWTTGKSVATLLAISLSCNAVTYGASIGLRVMEHSHVSLKIRLVSAPVTFAAVIFGVSFSGVYGAVGAMALCAFTQIFVWWSFFLIAIKKKLS